MNTIIKRWKKKSGPKTYDLRLRFDLDNKEICWMDCTCADFQFKRLTSYLDFADKKIIATPCKHLKPLIEMYQRDYGFKVKEKKPMEGTDRPTNELRKQLIERSLGLCENNCGRNGGHIHRKIRGSSGGKYNKENCVLLCPECHKRLHASEFSGSKSK